MFDIAVPAMIGVALLVARIDASRLDLNVDLGGGWVLLIGVYGCGEFVEAPANGRNHKMLGRELNLGV